MRLSASITARMIAAALTFGVRITERDCQNLVDGMHSTPLDAEPCPFEQVRLMILKFEAPEITFYPTPSPAERRQPNPPFYARFRKHEKRDRRHA